MGEGQQKRSSNLVRTKQSSKEERITCPALLLSLCWAVVSFHFLKVALDASEWPSLGSLWLPFLMLVASVMSIGTFYAAYMGALCGKCVDGEKFPETVDCTTPDW
jgi:hypothetical protein